MNLFDIGVSWEGKANDLIRFKGRGPLMILYNARDEVTGELCSDDNGEPETNGIQTKDYYIRDLFTLSPVIVIKDYLSFGEIKPREIPLSELQEVPEYLVGVEWPGGGGYKRDKKFI